MSSFKYLFQTVNVQWKKLKLPKIIQTSKNISSETSVGTETGFLLRLWDLLGKLKDPPPDRHHFCFSFINLYTFLQLVQANFIQACKKLYI